MSTEASMYKHIPIPTDGSPLSAGDPAGHQVGEVDRRQGDGENPGVGGSIPSLPTCFSIA
jgi:hypothetical protein